MSGRRTRTYGATQPTLATGQIPGEVMERMARLEPDIEVLAVDVGSMRGSPTVRIFLDAAEPITHETCARVTGHLTDLLRDYSIEVSSPGPERPLSRPEHYERFVGRRVRVRTREPIEGRRDFKARLVKAGPERVSLSGSFGEVTLDYQQIRRTNLVASSAQESARARSQSEGP